MAGKGRTTGKKSFYEVEAPMTAVKTYLYGSSLEEFEGKTIRLDLTKSLRGKNLELIMKVRNEEGKLKAEPIRATLIGAYIRRAFRRGVNYVEDSISAECRDMAVRIKPFLMTRRKVSRAVRKSLRDAARNYVEGYVKIRTAKELFSDIITNKMQKGLSAKLKKIYPLAVCEIRIFEIVKSKKDVGADVEKA